MLGLIETTRAALPLLRKSKGVIVNLATTIADQPFANMSVYCASKAAVLALTRSWAQELAPDGIRVNAVSPGPIETPMFSAEKLGIGAPALEQLGSSVLGMVPLRRFGKPEEVAQVDRLPGLPRVELRHRRAVHRRWRHGGLAQCRSVSPKGPRASELTVRRI